MSKEFQDGDVPQSWLLPPSVAELAPAGHLAHFIRDTVSEELDPSKILNEYREDRGFPPYHPVMMTALLLYASAVLISATTPRRPWMRKTK